MISYHETLHRDWGMLQQGATVQAIYFQNLHQQGRRNGWLEKCLLKTKVRPSFATLMAAYIFLVAISLPGSKAFNSLISSESHVKLL